MGEEEHEHHDQEAQASYARADHPQALAEGNKLLAGGQDLEDVCRHLEIAELAWHRWLAQYGVIESQRRESVQGARE